MLINKDKAKLIRWLQIAAELEMGTILPYLTALLSIKPSSNRGAAEAIRSVMTEEMLHLTLVANVLSSIGGGIQLNKDTIPSYPLTLNFEGKAFEDRKFPVDLAPFSESSIETFMKIEQPRSPTLHGVEFVEEIEIPGFTIGEFYTSLVEMLEDLDASGDGTLFCGDPRRQVSADYYWSAGGHPIIVTDLKSAKAALDIVIRQGEGAPNSFDDGDRPKFCQPYEVAHFYRFREIYFGRRYVSGDLPQEPPTGPELQVDYSAVYPIKVNARGSDYVPGTMLANLNDTFNMQYTIMLIQLEEALNGNPKTLYTAVMNGMHGLSPIASQMMTMLIEGDELARNGCPTFEWLEP